MQALRAFFKMLHRKTQTGTGVLAALLHDLLQGEDFTSVADVADALKWRAAKFRIPYDGGRISEALVSVGRTRPVLAGLAAARPARVATRPTGPVSDAEAAAILQRLGVRVL